MASGNPYKSEKTELVHSIESTQGTEDTSNLRYLGKIDDAVDLPDPEIDWQREYLVGEGKTAANKEDQQVSYEGGSITVIPVDEYPFHLLLGSKSSTSDVNVFGNSETGTTTYSITLGEDPQLSFTTKAVHYSYGSLSDDFIRTFTGCVVSSGSIVSDNEGQLSVDLDIRALDVSEDSGTFNQTFSDPPSQNSGWKFYNFENGNQLTVESSSYGDIKIGRLQDINFNIDLGTSTEYYVGSEAKKGKPDEHLYGNLELDADITFKFDNIDVYKEQVKNRNNNFKMDVTYQNKQTDERLRIIFKECNFESIPVPISEESQAEEIEATVLANDIEIKVEDK